MTTDKSSISQRIKDLNSDLTTMWRPVRQKVTDGMYDIALLQNFYKAWQSGVENNESIDEAYKDALKILPKDNPDTPLNEAVTEEQLKEKFHRFFKDKQLSPDLYGEQKGIDALKGDKDEIKNKLRYYMAQQFLTDSEIKAEEDEINDLRNIMQTSSVSTE